MEFMKLVSVEYSAPKFIIYDIAIEVGFSASLENPFEDPEQDW